MPNEYTLHLLDNVTATFNTEKGTVTFFQGADNWFQLDHGQMLQLASMISMCLDIKQQHYDLTERLEQFNVRNEGYYHFGRALKIEQEAT